MNHMSIEQAILQTKIYLKKGEEKKARELCEKFIQIYPYNIRIKKIMSSFKNSDISQDKIDDLINLYNQKEFKSVIKYAKDLIKQSPNSIIIWNLLAVSYTETESLEEAVTAFEKVKILKPDYFEVYNNLGFVFTKQRKFKKAIESFDKAIFLKPDYAAAYFNKGNALKEQNENQNAIEAYVKALSLQPNLTGCYINMGNILKDQGKLKEALISYEKALSLEPSNVVILQNIGVVFHLQGNVEESLDYYIKALSIDPNFENIYYNVAALLTVYTANNPNPKILEIISILIDKKTLIRPRDIMFLTINLLKKDSNLKKNLRNQYNINSNFLAEEVISELSEQTLLIKIMKKCPITDLDIENLLTKLRAKILFSLIEVENSNKYYKFQTALAMQCFMNDYIYETSQNEIDNLKFLEEKVIKSLKNNKQPDPQKILCLASYKPLYKYKWSYLINVNDDIKEVLTTQILEPLNENDLIKEIPTLGNISNEVSSKVRKLYEINPYPKWVNLRIPKSEKIDKVFSKSQLDIPDNYINTIKEPNILVAGCGTGQHAIETASRFKDCKVLAIDLSYSSLAYAKRKTKELNIKNIKYMQADILQLNKLKNKFHIIESVGVLHHMEDPLKGWKILTNLLEPGGLMRIGLYSDLARQSIAKFREKINGDFVNLNVDDIRLIRKSILHSNVSECKELLNFSEFFCINEIKDLLFHPQEHRFTLPQIQKILDELNLKFCGFDEQNVISGFRSTNYSLKDMYNLKKWQAYEEANPKTFLNMYQFWCQKQTSSKNIRAQKGLDDLNNSYQ